jgi:hypothetical protein
METADTIILIIQEKMVQPDEYRHVRANANPYTFTLPKKRTRLKDLYSRSSFEQRVRRQWEALVESSLELAHRRRD